MKFLLIAINAKYIHSNLAVYSLRACAGKEKEHIKIAEFTINNQKDYILEHIYKEKPDILFFSCYIWNIDYVNEIAKEFHKICPQIPIWAGGPEVSYEAENYLMEHPWITGVMIGEGEDTFRELCEYYDKDRHIDAGMPPEEKVQGLSEIAGLAYQRAGCEGDYEENEPVSVSRCQDNRGGQETPIIVTKARTLTDMSKIPFCYDRMEDFSNRIIYYESSRGCPFSCSYCLSSIDKKLRFRDLSLVKEELQFFIDQKVPQVKFVDRTFNCSHKHAMEIWKYIKEHDNGVTNFHFEISADLLNEEELALISDMRPGLIQLEIGVQSTNDVTIREIHRTMKLDLLKKIVLKIQEGENIHEHLDLIAGLPFEDYKTFGRSFDDIYALKPNQLQLGFLKVLKGSYMYEHAAEYDIRYHDAAPYEVLSTRWLPYSDVLRIKQVEEMLEVYYNSGQFEISMKVLELLFDSAFQMFQTLGEFYERMGYFGMKHSRNRRAEIVLEFLEEILPEERKGKLLEMMQEALTFDLYYRENCKSRPAWAPDMGGFKQMTHAYCKNGKISHIEPFHYRFPEKKIRTLKTLPEREAEQVWALFHYDRRDPLDHQAEVEYVDGKFE